jgi:hypothetical protein
MMYDMESTAELINGCENSAFQAAASPQRLDGLPENYDLLCPAPKGGI